MISGHRQRLSRASEPRTCPRSRSDRTALQPRDSPGSGTRCWDAHYAQWPRSTQEKTSGKEEIQAENGPLLVVFHHLFHQFPMVFHGFSSMFISFQWSLAPGPCHLLLGQGHARDVHAVLLCQVVGLCPEAEAELEAAPQATKCPTSCYKAEFLEPMT